MERGAVCTAERPQVREFEYADLPGYAVVTVDGARVTAHFYAGTGTELWRQTNLAALAQG